MVKLLGKIMAGMAAAFPMVVSAHLIAITPVHPFPATVPGLTNTYASYRVTNIAALATVTVIDQSSFPANSGLSIASSTCGTLLWPGQSCVINVMLRSGLAGQIVKAQLKEWAKPTADGVTYPIEVAVGTSLPTISIVPVNDNQLPALRNPVVAVANGSWLIVSGSMGNFHDFDNNFNTDLYVYNPTSQTLHSVSIAATDLPNTVKNQLASTSPESYQDGNTLYLIGGFYTPDNTNFATLNTLTSINVSGMMNAIVNNQTNLAQYVAFNTSIPEFRVTGGQLNKIGNDFYLAYGQDCTGPYCGTSQVYTNSIYRFTTDPTLASTAILATATHPDLDGSGWRRRDFTLAPLISAGVESLFAMGGPFTPGSDALVWTNGIQVMGNLTANNRFITQTANQYLSPNLAMYSASKNTNYLATFSGLSNLYWATNGLIYNKTTPYGNILDLITYNGVNVREYANLQPMCSGQPLSSCLYMGLTAEFIPAGNYYDSRQVLQIDQIPQTTPTLVGYIYAGLVSPTQDIFGSNQDTPTNKIYAVYVTPAGAGVTWRDITH